MYVVCVCVYLCACVSVCIWQRRRPTSDTIISHVAFLVAAPDANANANANSAVMVLAKSQMWQVAAACCLQHVGGLGC